MNVTSELAGLIRYAIGSWPRTFRLLVCSAPLLAALVVTRYT